METILSGGAGPTGGDLRASQILLS